MSGRAPDDALVARDRSALARPFWIVDGEAYDFTEWMEQHPGGHIWFRESMGRDISTLFHSYHREPQRLRKLLARYRIEGIDKSQVIPNMGVPAFLLPPGFKAATDLPTFTFGGKEDFRTAVMRKVDEAVPRKALKRLDRAFDITSAAFFGLHVVVLGVLVSGMLPAWACVLLLVLTRTALAGAGHFYLHRKRPNGKVRHFSLGNLPSTLFDFNYIATSLVGVDGHVILHHPHLGSGGDVKNAFLAGMRRLHPLLRLGGYTLQKLGMCLFAIPWLGFDIIFRKHLRPGIRLEFWLMRGWLVLELVACLVSGHGVAWLVQFILTLWVNTVLVTASHDFEDAHGEARTETLPEHLRGDWAARQLSQSHDLSIVGNRWVDVFLSAGLNTHRVHHVLPFQGSGFANIASEAAVRAACEEAGIRWERPRGLLTERLPAFVKHYLLLAPAPAAPVLQELRAMFHYVSAGWRTGAD